MAHLRAARKLQKFHGVAVFHQFGKDVFGHEGVVDFGQLPAGDEAIKFEGNETSRAIHEITQIG